MTSLLTFSSPCLIYPANDFSVPICLSIFFPSRFPLSGGSHCPLSCSSLCVGFAGRGCGLSPINPHPQPLVTARVGNSSGWDSWGGTGCFSWQNHVEMLAHPRGWVGKGLGSCFVWPWLKYCSIPSFLHSFNIYCVLATCQLLFQVLGRQRCKQDLVPMSSQAGMQSAAFVMKCNTLWKSYDNNMKKTWVGWRKKWVHGPHFLSNADSILGGHLSGCHNINKHWWCQTILIPSE